MLAARIRLAAVVVCNGANPPRLELPFVLFVNYPSDGASRSAAQIAAARVHGSDNERKRVTATRLTSVRISGLDPSLVSFSG